METVKSGRANDAVKFGRAKRRITPLLAGSVLMLVLFAAGISTHAGADTVNSGGVHPLGVGLEWSTYMGGSGYDGGNGIAVDDAGNVYVTGRTDSSGWVSGGFDTTYNGSGDYEGGDAFVAKLSSSGAHLWSTYLGGDSDDYGSDISVYCAGKKSWVFVTGTTHSYGWVSGGFDTTYNGGWDGFVVVLSESGAHIWSTYLGGSKNDYGEGIAVGDAGNIFVTGRTASSGWISGGFDTTYDGAGDAFVVELSGNGAHLWSTYLGGNSFDSGQDIAMDDTGNVFVAGTTDSSGWVLNGFDTTLNGDRDAFVAVLSGDGTAHLWSTYLGGIDNDTGYGIAVDGAGNVFVTGYTASSGWVSGGFDTTYNGGDRDAFVAVLSGDGTAHLWSTYLGGTGNDTGHGITVDGAGNVFVTGGTESSGWVSGGFNTAYPGRKMAFVAELSETGAHLWSTYLGGSDYDWGDGITVDKAGNVFVTGYTGSPGWVSGGFDITHDGSYDVFVAKIQDGPPCTGSLCVVIAPPESVAAGAQWRRLGATNWLDSGHTESGIITGKHTVEFKDVPEWAKPPNLDVNVSVGQTTNAGGTYLRPGSLHVIISPPEVVVAGAQWRRVGTATWLDSNCTETGIRPGDYTVEFKDVPQWSTAGNAAVTIVAEQTTNASGIYELAGCALVWSSYLGGSDWEWGNGIAVDGAENVFVTGMTRSSGWVSGGFDTTYQGGGEFGEDAFVAKLSSSGAHLWSTYLGGSDEDYGGGIAVDRAGNVFVTGMTESSGWVSGGFDTTYNGGTGYYGGDAFVAVLSGSGAHLWSTYLGGSGNDRGKDIAVDNAGNVFVTGTTYSSGWVSGGFDTTYNGWGNAFAVKLSGSGSHLWSTYLGGDSSGGGIAVDGAGNAFVTGSAGYGWEIPPSAFVAELSGSGACLWSIWSGVGGTSSSGVGNRVAVDGAGNVFVTGSVYSDPLGMEGNAFVSKFTGSGARLWSTYLGGSGASEGNDIAVGGAGNVFVTGYTSSPGWVSKGFDTIFNGGVDVFVAELSGGGEHLWSTYLDGSGNEEGYGIAVDGAGNLYVTGETESSGWVSGGFDTTYNGGDSDAFVAKIRDRISPAKVAREAWQIYE